MAVFIATNGDNSYIQASLVLCDRLTEEALLAEEQGSREERIVESQTVLRGVNLFMEEKIIFAQRRAACSLQGIDIQAPQLYLWGSPLHKCSPSKSASSLTPLGRWTAIRSCSPPHLGNAHGLKALDDEVSGIGLVQITNSDDFFPRRSR